MKAEKDKQGKENEMFDPDNKRKIFKAILWIIWLILLYIFISKIVSKNLISIIVKNSDSLVGTGKADKSTDTEEISNLGKIISLVCSFILTYIFNAIATGINLIKIRQENKPKLHLHEIETKGWRRTKISDDLHQFKIGNGKYFLYVKTEIHNVGNGIIEDFKLNNQIIHIEPIGTNEKRTFYVVVTSDDMTLNPEMCNLVCCFQDSLERLYQKKYRLLFDYDNSEVKYKRLSKQRRIWRG